MTHSPTNINIYIGRAVAIHKFQDIGRQVPLYDGLCEPSCGIKTTKKETAYPGRACDVTAGKVKYANLGIQDKLNKHVVTKPAFSAYGARTQNVVARYPELTKKGQPDVWYKVQIEGIPDNQNGFFDVQYDNAMACARRKSGHYLKSQGQDELQTADVSTALYACPRTCSHAATYISVC